MNIKNYKAAIFDMDGTLVDSMWVWNEVDVEYLKNHGYEVPATLKEEISHLSFDQCAIYFKEKFNLPYSTDEIKNHWNKMSFEKYRDEIKLKPGAKEFLKVLKANGFKIALATSNNMLLLEACLKSNGIFDYFDVISLTSEVERGKNFPDIYLLTAERLGVKPEECIAFEDILPAIKGAKAANMATVAVYDAASVDEHPETKKTADLFIKDFTEISI